MKQKAIPIRTLAHGKRVAKQSKFKVAVLQEVDGVINARAMEQLFGADWEVLNVELLADLAFYADKFKKVLYCLVVVCANREVDKTQVKNMMEHAKKVLQFDKAEAERCFIGSGPDEMTVPDRADDIAREVKLLGDMLRSRFSTRKAKVKAVARVREAVDDFLRARVKLPRRPKLPNE